VVGAIGIVGIFGPNQVMRMTALIAGFSAAVSLVLPDGTSPFTGDFRGLFPGKNQLGQAMVIGVLGGLHGIRVRGWRGYMDIGVVVLCSGVAFLSKSATSLLTIFAFFIFHVIGTFYMKGGIIRIVGICMAIFVTVILFLLMTNIDFLYNLLDKDPTLTGRTELWPYVMEYIYQRPLLGWGFAAFWMPWNPAAEQIMSAVGFPLNEAHNGLLQLLLDVGVDGTAFFLFLWMRSVMMAVKCINGVAPAIGVTSLAFLIGILLIGVTEQVLTTADGLTVQFFLLGFMCEKELRAARQARTAVGLRSEAFSLGQFADPRERDAV